MFPSSFKKFYAVLALSLFVGFGTMTMADGTATTGLAVSEAAGPVEFPWPVFLFGLFIGACAVGVVLLAFHYEHKRL